MVVAGGETSRSHRSAIKPTGWIRSNSPRVPPTTNSGSPRPRKPLSDRTNLPKVGNNHSTMGATPKHQSTLAGFLTPRLSKPRPPPPPPCAPSPSSSRGKQRVVMDSDDRELDQRATSLIQRRFGTRSLQPSPSMVVSKRPRSPSSSPPPPPPSPPPLPPRMPESPVRVESEEELLDSLSDQTPPRWVTALGASQMALYQRLAGLPPEEISALRQQRMREQVRKAHARLASPPPPKAKKTRRTPPPSPRLDPPREAFRSPRSNRKVYALETQAVPPSINDDDEDESETLPLEWPVSQDDETQALPWDENDVGENADSVQQVPTSDDEERMRARILLPSPSSSSSLTDDSPPRQASAVDIPRDRFGKLLASLHQHERKSHPGAQLSLTSFLKPTRPRDGDAEEEEKEAEWVTFSDDEGGVDDETQPLPWPEDDVQPSSLDSHRLSLPTLESMDNTDLLTPRTKRFVHNL